MKTVWLTCRLRFGPAAYLLTLREELIGKKNETGWATMYFVTKKMKNLKIQ